MKLYRLTLWDGRLFGGITPEDHIVAAKDEVEAEQVALGLVKHKSFKYSTILCEELKVTENGYRIGLIE